MNERLAGKTQCAARGAAPRLSLALIGAGKIARDAHVPALDASPDFLLTACVDPAGAIDGVPTYADMGELLRTERHLDAVAIATPPSVRAHIAAAALEAGLHVLLEKPPGVRTAEVDGLAERARARGRTLFAAWHSRAAPAVAPAQVWIAGKRIEHIAIRWREHVDSFHRGQRWIREADGFGVFDPAINAFSILTALCPDVEVGGARLGTLPGWIAPVRAVLDLRLGAAPIGRAEFDFSAACDPEWTIAIETDGGTLRIEEGGARLFLDGAEQPLGPMGEYPALYARFAALIARGAHDVDLAPLRLVEAACAAGGAPRP